MQVRLKRTANTVPQPVSNGFPGISRVFQHSARVQVSTLVERTTRSDKPEPEKTHRDAEIQSTQGTCPGRQVQGSETMAVPQKPAMVFAGPPAVGSRPGAFGSGAAVGGPGRGAGEPIGPAARLAGRAGTRCRGDRPRGAGRQTHRHRRKPARRHLCPRPARPSILLSNGHRESAPIFSL